MGKIAGKFSGLNKKVVVLGLMSYVPGLFKILRKGKGAAGTGGTNNPRYCYSVWLRHLVNLYKFGMTSHPKVVVEIGPGDSLGIGLCALLTGAEKFYAFDIIEHSNTQKNLAILDEVVRLFKEQTSIPDQSELPAVSPVMDSYNFPEFLKTLDISEEKVQHIRNAIVNGKSGNIEIKYVLPESDAYDLSIDSVDLIYSQAVFEHIDDLETIYKNMYSSLKTGGYSSHSIDFSSHQVHKTWNGHWYISDKLWDVIMHGMPYIINRRALSHHVELIRKNKFELLYSSPRFAEGFTDKNDLNDYLKKTLTEEDFKIKDSFVVFRK